MYLFVKQPHEQKDEVYLVSHTKNNVYTWFKAKRIHACYWPQFCALADLRLHLSMVFGQKMWFTTGLFTQLLL